MAGAPLAARAIGALLVSPSSSTPLGGAGPESDRAPERGADPPGPTGGRPV